MVIFSTEYIESSVIDLVNSISKESKVIFITTKESLPPSYYNFISTNVVVEFVKIS